MSKFVGTGPSSYKKRIYRAAVSQKLRNTGVEWRYTKFIKIKRFMKSNLYIFAHFLHLTNSLNFWVLFSQFLEL